MFEIVHRIFPWQNLLSGNLYSELVIHEGGALKIEVIGLSLTKENQYLEMKKDVIAWRKS